MVGELLPRVRIDATLYYTATMKDAMSNLYAHIMLFFRRAVKWYSKGTARRMFSSLVKPTNANFAKILANIKRYATLIEDIARTENRAETRGLTRGMAAQMQKVCEIQALLIDLQASSQRSESVSQRAEAISQQNQAEIRKLILSQAGKTNYLPVEVTY